MKETCISKINVPWGWFVRADRLKKRLLSPGGDLEAASKQICIERSGHLPLSEAHDEAGGCGEVHILVWDEMPRQPFEVAEKGFEAAAQRADSGLRIRREQSRRRSWGRNFVRIVRNWLELRTIWWQGPYQLWDEADCAQWRPWLAASRGLDWRRLPMCVERHGLWFKWRPI